MLFHLLKYIIVKKNTKTSKKKFLKLIYSMKKYIFIFIKTDKIFYLNYNFLFIYLINTLKQRPKIAD